VFHRRRHPTRRGDGHADLKYVYAAAEEVAASLSGYTVIVDKSTVPVGTAREVARVVRKSNPEADFDVASNPEFLREGSAIGDFMRPDRVVLGVESERAEGLLRELYRPLNLIEAPILVTDLESAELIKYASNAFLATKISFINEMSQLCEKTGADVNAVAKGMGMDKRIGNKFLHAGPGLRWLLFPQGHAGTEPHGPGARRVQPHRRSGGGGQRFPEGAHGSQDPRPPWAAPRQTRKSPCSASPSSRRPTTCAMHRPWRFCRRSRIAGR
jgi:hypothetical protein